MARYFVTRHRGAMDWALRAGIKAQQVAHLDVSTIARGDEVYGTLPVSLAGEVCQRGARYFHLTLDIPHGHRGAELSASDMDAMGASIEEYEVKKV
ncbi:MAG TPA: CRISPR-associated protein Csx16 [Devosia sp.]|nr:CRISPR-associated protein Csx16 [Devosia sp.]